MCCRVSCLLRGCNSMQGVHWKSNMSSGCAEHISVEDRTSSLNICPLLSCLYSFMGHWEWWWNPCWVTCHWLELCQSSSSRNRWVLWPLTPTTTSHPPLCDQNDSWYSTSSISWSLKPKLETRISTHTKSGPVRWIIVDLPLICARLRITLMLFGLTHGLFLQMWMNDVGQIFLVLFKTVWLQIRLSCEQL